MITNNENEEAEKCTFCGKENCDGSCNLEQEQQERIENFIHYIYSQPDNEE